MTIDLLALPDVQQRPDRRGVALHEVGIAALRLPVEVLDGDAAQATVATFEAVASLDADARGTHMSRLVSALIADGNRPLPAGLGPIAFAIADALDAPTAAVRVSFAFFIERAAPVSGLTAPLAVDARASVRVRDGENLPAERHVGVTVAVTSLCPCSKEISDYGAHSQRGRVSIDVRHRGEPPALHELVAIAESAGSAPVHPLLKRSDERHVTMLAFDRPRFVEDVARDAALALGADERVLSWEVEVVNEESIHAHDAIARVRGSR